MLNSAFMLLLSGALLSLRLGPGSGSFPRTLRAEEERDYVEAWVERGSSPLRAFRIRRPVSPSVGSAVRKTRRPSRSSRASSSLSCVLFPEPSSPSNTMNCPRGSFCISSLPPML